LTLAFPPNKPRETAYSRESAADQRRIAARAAQFGARATGNGAPAIAEDEAAARREQAAARAVELARHYAGDRGQPALGRALRQRGEQRGGVRVVRIGEQRAGRVRLHLLTRILHHDAVGGLRDDAHVMGDEH
jgi:hypothetical protein